MPNLSSHQPRTVSDLLVSYAKTSVFCAAIGFTLWLLKLAEPLWAAFLVSFAIGYSITTASVLLHPVFLRYLPAIAAAGITAVVGVGVGLLIGGWGLSGNPTYFFTSDGFGTPILGLFFGVLGLLFFTTQEQLKDTRAELAQARADRLSQEKEHLETQLKLLQAQIEPHFLFNTLSNVVGMIREQPDAAEKTLIDLTTLLRANLKRTRTEETTLEDELAIVSALLEINQIRMGNRLSWSIDAEADLRKLPLPPMLLQPLVENAVKHGIEPLEEGGEIHIRAEGGKGCLTVVIEDTGPGPGALNAASSTGVGVTNVQNRLAALFDKNASLVLEENVPRGMVATLTIPVPSI